MTSLWCGSPLGWVIACLLWLGVVAAVLVGIALLFPSPRRNPPESGSAGENAGRYADGNAESSQPLGWGQEWEPAESAASVRDWEPTEPASDREPTH